MTEVVFDLTSSILSAGFNTGDSYLIRYQYLYPIELPNQAIIENTVGYVELVNGVATAEIPPTPAGNGLTVRLPFGRPRPPGPLTVVVSVPDSASPVQFTDLARLDPTTLAPASEEAPTAAWLSAPANEVSARTSRDEAFETELADNEATDVDLVAGLGGDISAAALKAALNLPANAAGSIADEIVDRISAVNEEASARAAADSILTTAVNNKQPLATMLTKLVALASTMTDGQLIKWDATLGEPVAMNPVGASRLAAAVNATGTVTAMAPGASGGAGAIVSIPLTTISIPNSNGRPVVIRFGATFYQTVAGAGLAFLYLRETTAGNTADRKICVQPLTGSAAVGNQFATCSDEYDIGAVTTTRTFELRCSLFTPAASTPVVSAYNSVNSPTWLRADAA